MLFPPFTLAEARADAHDAMTRTRLVCESPDCDATATTLARDPIHGWLPDCGVCAFGADRRAVRLDPPALVR